MVASLAYLSFLPRLTWEQSLQTPLPIAAWLWASGGPPRWMRIASARMPPKWHESSVSRLWFHMLVAPSANKDEPNCHRPAELLTSSPVSMVTQWEYVVPYKCQCSHWHVVYLIYMQYPPAELLLSRLASPPRCKSREKLTERHICCVAAALGEALPVNNISTGKNLCSGSVSSLSLICDLYCLYVTL